MRIKEEGEKTKTEQKNIGKTVENISGRENKDAVKLEQEVLFFGKKIARESKTSLGSVRWLTTGEAAQYLRVSISSIKTMIYRGQVRVHKLGRRNRFLIDELERLITLPHTKAEV
jgi:excisionase family DNA binding protein